MSEAVQQPIDELDRLLERMTLPEGFPNCILRNVLRDVLETAPSEYSTDLAALNQVMIAALETVKSVPVKSREELAELSLDVALNHFNEHKHEPHTFVMPISAESKEKSTTWACELAQKLRAMLPSTVFVLVGSVNGDTCLYTVQGKKLSEVIRVEANDRSIVALIHGDEFQPEAVAAGESWEDCIKRVLPNNDKPLILFSPESPDGSESGHNRYIIRGHDDPGYTDSEGFRYVKDYSGRALTWTYSAQRAKRFSYTEACYVRLLLKEARTDSEMVASVTDTDCSTPELGKPVEQVRVRSFTDDDWTIKAGKSRDFYISRTRDGVFLAGVLELEDEVGYGWVKTEEEARKFDSLAAANDYASEVLLLQTFRGSETPMPVKVGPKVGRNDPCPCGSGKKWKKCCMRAK